MDNRLVSSFDAPEGVSLGSWTTNDTSELMLLLIRPNKTLLLEARVLLEILDRGAVAPANVETKDREMSRILSRNDGAIMIVIDRIVHPADIATVAGAPGIKVESAAVVTLMAVDQLHGQGELVSSAASMRNFQRRRRNLSAVIFLLPANHHEVTGLVF